MENNSLINVKYLLQKLLSLQEKYEEFDKLTGNNFNLFRIIRKGHEEVGLHSAFLVELLNSQGSHAMVCVGD